TGPADPEGLDHHMQIRTGLTSAMAASRLEADGPNELPAARGRRLLDMLLRILAEPMFLLLCVAVVLYVVLGELREALVLATSLVAVVVISASQERRAERALEALRDLSSPRAAVLRDGELRRVAGREVVRGDTVMLAEGDRVPADGVLLESIDLEIDESLLTGESLPAAKLAAQATTGIGEAPAESRVFSGCLVVRGHATAEITATGAGTELGRIGHALATLKPQQTLLYRETRRMVLWLAVLGVALCLAVLFLYAALRGGWVEGALAGITLAMSILPEEFAVVLTVFLALGAWRLSRQGVLTRRMPAIEALGAATVLAVDKTGTLTENRMIVSVLDDGAVRLALDGRSDALDPGMRDLLGAALAACEIQAFDPMERAIAAAARQHAPQHAEDLGRMALVHEYELTAELLAVTHVWKDAASGHLLIATKGAPEAIAGLCRLEAAEVSRLLERVEEIARDGQRVLAVARAELPGEKPPATPREMHFRLLGLIGLRDPVRKTVPAALAHCHRAGIRVVMITGDHPGTARAVAQAVGLDHSRGLLTGSELASMDEATLRERASAVNVYARVAPAEKLRLVRALRAHGGVVAMTGDGVNDAPALKAADIGIAMGSRGTDVAREAASLVLVDDDFGGLVTAIRMGRRIYENIRSAMSYLLAVHIPLAGAGLLPLLLGWPLLLFPLHVVFLEFVIDPACSLVFEGEHRGEEIMRRPPRAQGERLFSGKMLLESVALGLVSLAAVALVYGIALSQYSDGQARALAFIVLVVNNLALILVSRSQTDSLAAVLRRPNRAFWVISVLAIGALIGVCSLPSVSAAFRFEAPPISAALAAAVTGMGIVAITGILRSALRAPERRR
ncbi:MAG: cation-translocating P-type ATPase, partial [Steroidobacteraceae bacterium]